MGVKRFGVAFLAAASVGVWCALPASAQEAPPPAADPPAETTSTTTTSTPAATPAPDPAPSSASTEPAEAVAPAPEATPSTDTATAGTPSSESTAAADEKSPEATTTTSEPADAKPAVTEATSDPKDAVKLEPAPLTAAAAPPTAPALQPVSTWAQTQASAATQTQVTIVLVTEAQAAADPAAATTLPSARTAETAETADTRAAPAVSLRPRPAPSAISLLPMTERTVASVRPDSGRAIPAKTPVRPTCARPTARVPLSALCVQVRAISALRVRLTYLPSSEVRAAIVRGPSRVSIRRVEGRTPPKSPAAKKHPVAEARPTVPFGSSGHGAADHSFTSSSGATWSSRVLVLAAPPVRVPRPSRFARVRIPTTIPHGVIAAPPPARPG